MPKNNYREVKIKIQGAPMMVAGLQQPEFSSDYEYLKENQVEAVINLRGEGSNWNEKFAKQLKEAGFDLDFYTDDFSKAPVYIHDWFNDESGRPAIPAPPSTHDAIYQAVLKAQQAEKKVAIFCQGGNGRTGTALACLKLRELLEQALAEHPENFLHPVARSEIIHVEQLIHMVQGRGMVPVTPLVRAAILSVRACDNPSYHSIELANDVESVLLYEQHLRQILVQQASKEGLAAPYTDALATGSPAQKMMISQGYDYWKLLHRNPPTHYHDLIAHAEITEGGFCRPLSQLARELESTPLNLNQKMAFLKALWAHTDKVGGRDRIEEFMRNAGYIKEGQNPNKQQLATAFKTLGLEKGPAKEPANENSNVMNQIESAN